jgi:hypothetical protein
VAVRFEKGAVLQGRSLGPLVKTRAFGMTPRKIEQVDFQNYATT